MGGAYKVMFPPKVFGTVSLQQALQQSPGRLGHTSMELQGGVKDVLKHLGLTATVERGLRKRERKEEIGSKIKCAVDGIC